MDAGLARYRDRAAVVIDIEVLGYPRTISRQENGSTISEKYDCIYTVALMPDEPHVGICPRASSGHSRDFLGCGVDAWQREHDRDDFAEWCAKEFCGVEPEPVSHSPANEKGRVIGGAVMPHTIPMYEARHRPNDHRNKSLAAIDQVRQQLDECKPDVIVLASTHWMPRDGFFIDDGAQHEDGCDASYQGVEPQLFSFPGDPELAALIGDLARSAGLPVRRIHRVAQEHAVWVPCHLLCRERRIPLCLVRSGGVDRAKRIAVW